MDQSSISVSATSNTQSLTHKLLLELLAYQFASPVKWIDTQNELLQRRNHVQRIVEIGPAKVLATMAKKSADSKPGSRSLDSRQFLSHVNELQDIYFEYNTPNLNESREVSTSPIPIPAAVPTSIIAAPVAPIEEKVPLGVEFVAVPDIPLAPTDIILAVVAHKLRKPFDQVSIEKSLRQLSGGKSTLQNELIGDLGAEFGTLPDGCEDLSLETIGSSLLPSFSGRLNKHVSTLISKLISSKMPGEFKQSDMRNYLGSYWGLGPNCQTTVLCYALSFEPPARLPSLAESKAFVDTVVTRYAAFAGVSISPVTANSGSRSESTTQIDPASLNAATKEQKEYLTKQFKLLSQHLQLDSPAENGKLAELTRTSQQSSESLELFNKELGEDFLTGIKPKFDPKKSRVYDSWWNWIQEDLASLFHEERSGSLDLETPQTRQRILAVSNRWNQVCTDVLEYQLSLNMGSKLALLLSQSKPSLTSSPVFIYNLPPEAPCTEVSSKGDIVYSEIPRQPFLGEDGYSELIVHGRPCQGSEESIPWISIQKQSRHGWEHDKEVTDILMGVLKRGCKTGLSFSGTVVLVTGAGPGSIGAEIVQGLLSGGATVIVTTSREPSSTAEFYNTLYKKFGAKNSELILFPFNQGSKEDCKQLIEHIYDRKTGLGLDIDFIVPFAAISENVQIDKLGAKAELAHRIMLVNLLRILGHIKQEKEARGFDTNPTGVILPLSPNHGTFGGDGLYGESKLGLETLFNRSKSENWSSYLTICGTVIGWTRGTGLMSANNIVAQAVESFGTLTFSQPEMAFNILALMTPEISLIYEETPIYVDLSGGMDTIENLKDSLTSARNAITSESRLRKLIAAEDERQMSILHGPPAPPEISEPGLARLELGFPNLPEFQTLLGGAPELQGMLDLQRTIVIVGFSELSPWGSVRTRWEMEHQGALSTAGYIELAWIMGLVKHYVGEKEGKTYVGWIDAKTKEPVRDHEFEMKYGKYILQHSGIRLIEPGLFDGYDPEKKEFLQEVVIEEELPKFETSKDNAEAFKLRHGEKCEIRQVPGSEEYEVTVKKGATFLLPKAVPFDRRVAGQLPSGFNPIHYGVPEDIVSQVDPVTVYALCCVAEAFLSAGIEDPYELYKYIHVSELANCLGTGAGGLKAMRGVYRDRYLERPIQSDILQESYLNAMGAWVNMLYLASTGPIKSPVGACATGVESLDAGCEAILSGTVKVAVVGGSDDFQEEMSYEFANMKATSSSEAEFAKGRLPNEMSRPTTTSRSGFMESAGCGVQVIMNAELALQMGLPIHGVVAYTQMAGDRISKSVPAPGQGVLTAARETANAALSPLLDIDFRRHNLKKRVLEIVNSGKEQLVQAKEKLAGNAELFKAIMDVMQCEIRDAQNLWGNNIRRQNPNISPIRASLATWGMTIDDIQVAHLHGTSTKANDFNESDMINKQMEHLGRTKGNPLAAVNQKFLTGHPKGAAASWMLNGCLQVLQSGIIPGNRNADNIEEKLQKNSHLYYPSHSVMTTGVKAIMLTSFGFGQKGGIVIVIAPKYLFSAIDQDLYDSYRAAVKKRQSKANSAFVRGLMSNSIFRAKKDSPWKESDESQVFLDPTARVTANAGLDLGFDVSTLTGSKHDTMVGHKAALEWQAFLSGSQVPVEWLGTSSSSF